MGLSPEPGSHSTPCGRAFQSERTRTNPALRKSRGFPSSGRGGLFRNPRGAGSVPAEPGTSPRNRRKLWLAFPLPFFTCWGAWPLSIEPGEPLRRDAAEIEGHQKPVAQRAEENPLLFPAPRRGGHRLPEDDDPPAFPLIRRIRSTSSMIGISLNPPRFRKQEARRKIA